MERLLLVMVLMVFIHLIITMNYSIRLAGLRTRRLLMAVSIFNIVYLLASVSSTLQAPLLTSMVEHAIKAGMAQVGTTVPADQLIYQEAYREQMAMLAGRIRLLIMASTVGTFVGAILTPAFVHIFTRAIQLFEEVGSVTHMFMKLAFSFPLAPVKQSKRVLRNSLNSFLFWLRQKLMIPKTLLVANIVVNSIFTVGGVSALYAGALFPDFRSTAMILSGIVTGTAVVIGAIVVEPKVSLITDEAMRGDRGETEVKQLTLYMVITRFLGTLFAQVIFLPVAVFIKLIVQFLAK